MNVTMYVVKRRCRETKMTLLIVCEPTLIKVFVSFIKCVTILLILFVILTLISAQTTLLNNNFKTMFIQI